MTDHEASLPEPTPLHRPVTEQDIERALLENIESLLAGDIDHAAEQSRFFARHRLMAATGLAKLLIQDRLPVAGAGFHMIEALTFGYPQDIFRQIALNPHAPDVVRFGAHRRLGWSHAGSREQADLLRLEFLSTLHDPQAVLAETAITLLTEWPGGLEIIDEIVRYLTILPAAERLAILRRIVSEASSHSIWLLHAMLPVADAETQLFALRELARQRGPASGAPVTRLVRTTRDDEVRREAEATAQRLRLRAVDRSTTEIQWSLPANRSVRASAVGLDGTQSIVLTYEGEQTPKLIVEFLVSDEGIVDAAGRLLIMPIFDDALDEELDEEFYDAEDDELLEEEDELDAPEYIPADIVRPFPGGMRFNSQLPIDVAVARGVIADGLERHAATGRPLPPTFELWEPFLHDELPPATDEPLVSPLFDEDAADSNRLDAIAAGMLIVHPAFSGWLVDAARMLAAMEGVPPPSSSRWSLKQFRPLVERLFTDDDIGRIRRSLLRQAWLLDLGGDARERDLALRAAASLRSARFEDLPKHPLIREVLQRSASAALNPYGYALRQGLFGLSDAYGPF